MNENCFQCPVERKQTFSIHCQRLTCTWRFRCRQHVQNCTYFVTEFTTVCFRINTRTNLPCLTTIMISNGFNENKYFKTFESGNKFRLYKQSKKLNNFFLKESALQNRIVNVCKVVIGIKMFKNHTFL